MNIFNVIIDVFIVYFLSIILHELGHIIMYKLFIGFWPKVKITKEISITLKKTLTRSQKISINVTGILLGLLPFVTLFSKYNYYSCLIFILGYLFGCKWDLEYLEKLIFNKTFIY